MSIEINSKNFEERVLGSEIPTVIDFYSKFCTPCKLMDNILAKLAGEYDGKVTFYRVDTDRETELSQKLKVSLLPTVLFLSGGKMDIQRGTTTEDKMRAKIEALSDGDNNN